MFRDIFNAYRDAFRQWVRSKTRAKTVFEAEERRLFWSKCYLFSVICVVGIYTFNTFKERSNLGTEKGIPTALRLAKGMNENESVRFVKYSGFQLVSDKTFKVKDIKKDENVLTEGTTSAPNVS